MWPLEQGRQYPKDHLNHLRQNPHPQFPPPLPR